MHYTLSKKELKELALIFKKPIIKMTAILAHINKTIPNIECSLFGEIEHYLEEMERTQEIYGVEYKGEAYFFPEQLSHEQFELFYDDIIDQSECKYFTARVEDALVNLKTGTELLGVEYKGESYFFDKDYPHEAFEKFYDDIIDQSECKYFTVVMN
jgi:YHS domain-containing protein